VNMLSEGHKCSDELRIITRFIKPCRISPSWRGQWRCCLGTRAKPTQWTTKHRRASKYIAVTLANHCLYEPTSPPLLVSYLPKITHDSFINLLIARCCAQSCQ
jgi:hypothetical protein